MIKTKSRTCNNSLSNIKSRKFSVKRINNLSYRIQSLQDDINRIENIKKKIKVNNNNTKMQSEKNLLINMNDSDIKDNSKDINKTFVKNPSSLKEQKKTIKYLKKNHSQKENNKLEINKENIIFKRKISDRRNIFLRINSNNKKPEKLKIFKKDISENNYHNNISKIPKKQYNYIKINNLLSADRLNINSNLKKSKKFEENKNSSKKNILSTNEVELNHLKKRIKIIIEQRNELNQKLLIIKNKNKKLENIIEKEQNNNIIENLIVLNKEYLDFKNNYNYYNNKLDIKDILFNIMDIKFDYENNILYEKFIQQLNKLLIKKPILNINNTGNNIINKINRLLYLKNKLQNLEEKYNNKKIDNTEYYNYFTSLITKLKLKSFEQLKEYIKDLFIKNIQENKKMKEILNGLINNNNFNLPNKKEQTPKIKYINNAFLLNKKGRNESNRSKNRQNNHTNIIKDFRNKRKNSFNSHGICYNSYVKINKRRNFNNEHMNKKFFRSEINRNNNLIKFNSMNIDNDIHLLKEE